MLCYYPLLLPPEFSLDFAPATLIQQVRQEPLIPKIIWQSLKVTAIIPRSTLLSLQPKQRVVRSTCVSTVCALKLGGGGVGVRDGLEGGAAESITTRQFAAWEIAILSWHDLTMMKCELDIFLQVFETVRESVKKKNKWWRLNSFPWVRD